MAATKAGEQRSFLGLTSGLQSEDPSHPEGGSPSSVRLSWKCPHRPTQGCISSCWKLQCSGQGCSAGWEFRSSHPIREMAGPLPFEWWAQTSNKSRMTPSRKECKTKREQLAKKKEKPNQSRSQKEGQTVTLFHSL